MTREQKIAAIRAACVKANPEILKLCRGEEDRPHYCPNCDNSFDRPIRLADVLLAIDMRYKGDRFATVASNGWFHFGSNRAVWNLRHDDVTLQSDDCIDFIYSLVERNSA